MNDLQRALSLSAAELCTEVDKSACAEAHRVLLGNGDPFKSELYVAAKRPLATTGLATERVVLGACSNRVARDKQTTPVVFTNMNLSGALPTEASALRRVVETQATILYRRLLARVPSTSEIDTLAALTVDSQGKPVSGETFAKLACFAVGTTSEFLLY